MATVYYTGNAPKIAQVQTYTFGGTWEADDVVKVAIGTKVYYFTGGSTTITTAIDNIVTAWNALDSTVYPEFAEITASRSSSKLVLTADTAGMPFVATLTPLEVNLGAADSQTIEGGTTATTGTAATANSGPNDWSVALNWSGSAVPANSDTVYIENNANDISYGLSQSAVTLTALYISSTYTGKIGLPQVRAVTTGVSYYEYRATYLAISATTLQIGSGAGRCSGRIKIDTGSNATGCTVYGMASAYDSGVSALLLKGTHASNALDVYGGTVGVCELSGETARFPVIRVNAVTNNQAPTLTLGKGIDSSAVITAMGGAVNVNSAVTTITQYGGTVTDTGTGTVGTLAVYGGTFVCKTTGTLYGAATAKLGSGAVLDFDQDARTKNGLVVDAYRGAKIVNSNGTLNSFQVNAIGCRQQDIEIQTGYGIYAGFAAS